MRFPCAIKRESLRWPASEGPTVLLRVPETSRKWNHANVVWLAT